jgi:hypothetical protein
MVQVRHRECGEGYKAIFKILKVREQGSTEVHGINKEKGRGAHVLYVRGSGVTLQASQAAVA